MKKWAFTLSVVIIALGYRFGTTTATGERRASASGNRTADGWLQIARLVAEEPTYDGRFGKAVDVGGDLAVIGACDGCSFTYGAAFVFARDQGGLDAWGQVARLIPSNSGGDFGESVAVDGYTAVVGAPLAHYPAYSTGCAFVFYRHEGGADNWGQVTRLFASDAGDSDGFGRSVALEADTAIAGAAGWDLVNMEDDNVGAAYVFDRNEGGPDSWGQVTQLLAGDPDWGDSFGGAVAVSGDYAVVGAAGDDDVASRAGAAYVFYRDEGGPSAWGQVAKLLASDGQEDDLLGSAVAVSGDTIVVGAWGVDTAGTNAGAAYVFYRHEGGADNWGQVAKLTGAESQVDDRAGSSAGVDGDLAVLGTHYGETAYVFYRHAGGPDSWGQIAKLETSDGEPGDAFGKEVAVSGDVVLGGAPQWDAPVGVGDEGAVYVFGFLVGLNATNDGPTALAATTTLTASLAAGSDPVYTWDLGDGTLASGEVVTHTFPSVGHYTATVTATTSIGALTAETVVAVHEPVTGLTAYCTSPVTTAQEVECSATVTGGGDVDYAWQMGDGAARFGSVVTHTYMTLGHYTATVTATNLVSSMSSGAVVDVQEPVSGLAASCTSPVAVGQAVECLASVTAGSDLSYHWDFADGHTDSGMIVSHSYDAPQSYEVTVTAQNLLGTAVASTTVIVHSAVFLPALMNPP